MKYRIGRWLADHVLEVAAVALGLFGIGMALLALWWL